MERSQILETMSGLKLFGMKAAYDEIIATAVKRQHEPQRIVGDLLAAEIAEKQARSIKYQMTIARLPLAKDLGDFAFDGTPINATLVHDLAGGEFLAHERNVVLVGGTGTGKTHLAIAIARACIRSGARGRFFNVVDLVNKLEAEGRAGRQGRMADYLSRMDFIVLDELGYLPFAQIRWPAPVPPDQPALRADLDHRHHQPRLRRMAERLRRRQDDHGPARSPHPSLRHRRDRQRELALQEPRLTVRLPTGCPGGCTGTSRAVRSPVRLEHARSRRGPLLCTTGTTSSGGQHWTPIGGQSCEPFDSNSAGSLGQGIVPTTLSSLTSRPSTADRAWLADMVCTRAPAGKLAILAEWVAAAGGRIDGEVALLPPLPRRLATLNLHRILGQFRIEVRDDVGRASEARVDR